MSLTYKKATADDIDLLVKTRIEVLRAANNLPDDTDMREVEKESYLYYIKAIPEETHTAFLVFDDDCFAGSGATGIAAKATGRRAVLIEQEESYCRMIRRRLENDTPLFDFAEGNQ